MNSENKRDKKELGRKKRIFIKKINFNKYIY